MPLMRDTLASYPYVVVRLSCSLCYRRGSYRLARLADKYGANCAMQDLLWMLTGDCKYAGHHHPMRLGCGAYFCDLGSGKPPDEPTRPALRLVNMVEPLVVNLEVPRSLTVFASRSKQTSSPKIAGSACADLA